MNWTATGTLALVAIGVPALLAGAATPWVRRLSLRWGLVDQPAARKVHEAPMPMGGGLAIWLGLIIPCAVGSLVAYGIVGRESVAWLPDWAAVHVPGIVAQLPKLWGLLAAATVLMVLGLLDDRLGLPWTWRLGCQFAIAAVVVAWQDWRLTAFIEVPAVTYTLSVLWIVALINAFNMLDNMDGLSAGVASIAATMLGVSLVLTPDPSSGGPQLFVAGLLWLVAGATAGFWWHNRAPAKLFMGDAGSYLIGFTVAVSTMLATYTGYEHGNRLAVFAPLCVMAVPLYDMVTVILIRLRQGRSPFHADKNHFSHRLVQLGFSKSQAVSVIHLLTFTTGIAALILPRTDTLGAVMVIMLVSCILVLITLLEHTGRTSRHDP